MSDNSNAVRSNSNASGNRQHRQRSNRSSGVIHYSRVPVTTDYIGAVVGKGGNTVTKIKEETGARVSLLSPQPGQGHLVHCFSITGNNRASVDHAERWIRRIIGNTYKQDHPEEFQDEEAQPEASDNQDN